MKINEWPEAEKGSYSCPSQREAQELVGIQVYTLNRAQRKKVQMKFFFSYFSHLPSFDQSKDRYKSKGHQASVFPMFIKILFCLLLHLALQSPALSTEQQEKGMEYILAHASLYI